MPAFKTLLPKKDSGGDDLSTLKEELLVLAALKSNDVDYPESIELMHSISDEVEQCTTLEEVETLMHSITVEVKQGTTEEEVETLFTDAAALPVPVAAVKPSKDQDDAAPMPESDTAKKVAEMKVEMEKKLEAAKKAAEAERIEAEKREKLRREKAEKAAELERLAVAKREEIKAQKAAEAALEAQRKAEKAAEEAVRRAEIREEKERQKELERQRKKQAMVEKAKKSAVNDLELALKRVEKTRNMEEMIKNKQYFGDDDDLKSVSSRFSTFSKKVKVPFKSRGRGFVGGIIEDTRDDSSGTNSKHSKHSGAGSKISEEVNELKSLVSDLQKQLKEKSLEETDKRVRFSKAKSGKSTDSKGNRFEEDDIREAPEREPYQEAGPMPSFIDIDGWISWFMGDPEDNSHDGSRQSLDTYGTDATDTPLFMERAKKLLRA